MLLRPEGFRPQADAWEYLHDAMERGLTLEARVVRVTWPEGRPVWEVELPAGIKGLVPASETGLGDAAAMPRYTGQVINVKVKGLDRENALAACSRREAVAEGATFVAAATLGFDTYGISTGYIASYVPQAEKLWEYLEDVHKVAEALIALIEGAKGERVA